MSQESESRSAIGSHVIGLVYEAVPDEVRDDPRRMADLLLAVEQAFPHTSISELVSGMVGGIVEAGHF